MQLFLELNFVDKLVEHVDSFVHLGSHRLVNLLSGNLDAHLIILLSHVVFEQLIVCLTVLVLGFRGVQVFARVPRLRLFPCRRLLYVFFCRLSVAIASFWLWSGHLNDFAFSATAIEY